MMAECDACYGFRMVDVGARGLESDGGIFKESIFGSTLINSGAATATLQGTDVINLHVFVTDAVVPLHPDLMCPFPVLLFIRVCRKMILQ